MAAARGLGTVDLISYKSRLASWVASVVFHVILYNMIVTI